MENKKNRGSRGVSKTGEPLCTGLIICSWKPVGKIPSPPPFATLKASRRQTCHHEENRSLRDFWSLWSQTGAGGRAFILWDESKGPAIST